jgi:competence protein ComEC
MGSRVAWAPALALWAGTLAGLARGSNVGVAGAACAVVVLAILALRATRFPRTVALLLILSTGLAGFARGAAHRVRMDAQRAALIEEPRLTRMVVDVVGPGARGGEFIEVAVRAARPPLRFDTRLRLRLPEGHPAEWGDRLRVLAGIERSPGSRNPGGFDAAAADFARGVAGRGRVFAVSAHDAGRAAAWPRATVARWRRAIERVLDERLSEAGKAYVVPLMTGDRSDLAPEMRARVRDAGLAHLLALSGLHAGWLALLARALVIAAGGGLVARALAGAVASLLYLGIAGVLPALCRATLAELWRSLARLTQRSLDPVQALALSVIVLLSTHPGWALDLAFQLSCAATLGIVTIGSGGPIRGARRLVLAPLRVTGAAQLAAAPLLIARFHGLSYSVWLANLAAVPLAGLLLAAAWAATLLELAAPGLGRGLFSLCDLLARGLDTVAGAAASLPFAFVPCGEAPLAVVASAAAAALCVSGAMARHPETPGATVSRGARRMAAGVVFASVAVVASLVPAPRRPPSGKAWVVVLDIGQGDAIALGFADGWWLVDAGPRAPGYDAGESVVVPFFRWLGERRLAGLVVTHRDADHAGGAPAVWRALAPRRVIGADPTLAALGPPHRVPLDRVAAGDTLHAGPALTVAWPPAGWVADSRNDGSVVLMLDVNGTRALLAADIDSLVEPRIDLLGALALLKVAHHGSRSSTSAAFLARARPRHAALSSGRANPFGHPHEETLARLDRVGAMVHRTDREGAAWFELSPAGVRVIDWRVEIEPPMPTAPVRGAARAPRAR